MRDLKDLKKEEGGASAKKVPTLAVVGLLGLLVFFALVMFFRGRNQDPPPPEVAMVDPAPPAQIDSPPVPPPAEGEASSAPEPGLKPGEIHFSEKKEEVVSPPPPSPDAKSAKEKGTSLPKEDLTFFKTLKDKKEGSVALKSKKEQVRAKPKNSVQTVKASPAFNASSDSLKRYSVQVASFSEKKGADRLAQKLKEKGLASYVVAGEIPEKGKRYRVRVGPYRNRDEARKVGDRLHASERLNFFITSD